MKDQKNMAPESTLFGKKVLDMPQRHRLGGYLHPVGHWLTLLMREGVHCYSDLARSSLDNEYNGKRSNHLCI